MKKLFFLLAMALGNILAAGPIEDRKISEDAYEELFAFFEIKENIVEETQKKWLRKQGKERWEIDDLPEEQRTFVIEWAEKEGIFKSWMPSRPFYEKAFILGASTPSLKTRIVFLKELWEGGTRFNEIIILTGDRPLDPKIDEWTDICKTETDAAHHAWEITELPQEMRALPVSFFSIPMRWENGIAKRPTTYDTIIGYVNKFPTPCSCIFISNQPHCGYQFAVIKHSLPQEFPFDIAGKGTQQEHAAIILDMLARWIYANAIEK